jgi:hypothetical protein
MTNTSSYVSSQNSKQSRRPAATVKVAAAFLIAIASVIVSSGPARAGDGMIGGHFFSRQSFDFEKNNRFEDVFESRSYFLLEGKYKDDNSNTWYLSPLFKYDVLHGPDTRFRWNVEVWEGYCELTFDDFDLRIGKLITKWGKADGINPVDVPNPANYEQLLFTEMEMAKIPIPMAVLDYYLGDYKLQTLFVPFYYPVRMGVYGDDWSIMHRRTMYDYTLYDMQLEDYVDYYSVLGTTEFPARHPGNFEYGLSFATTGADIDWALYYYYGWQDQPTYYFDEAFIDYLERGPDKNAISALETIQVQEIAAFLPIFSLRTNRFSMVGADFSTIVGDFVLRGEAAFIERMNMYKKNLSVYETPTISWVLGGEYNSPAPLNVYFNAQIFQMVLLQSNSESMLLDRYNQFGTLAIRRSFMHEELEFDSMNFVDLNSWGLFSKTGLTWKQTSQLHWTIGFLVVESNEQSALEYFRENDAGYLVFEYIF